MQIRIRGAHENNLRDVSLDVPHGALTVFTGVSGSGKSSLVFDTIAREGRRRFLEALAADEPRIAGGLERARVESIDGLSPTIALEPGVVVRDPRSTVATLSGVHGPLRRLFAVAGVPHCPRCGRGLEAQSADRIGDDALARLDGRKVLVCAPVVRRRRGRHRPAIEELIGAGFPRLRLDGRVVRVNGPGAVDAPWEELADDRPHGRPHDVDVVFDRIAIRRQNASRLREAIGACAELSGGFVTLVDTDGEVEHVFNLVATCPECRVGLPEIEPRLFSHNTPLGACDRCDGRGVVSGHDRRGRRRDAATAPCDACGGRRLRPEALAVRLDGESIADLCALPVEGLLARIGGLRLDGLAGESGGELVSQLTRRLESLVEVGLPYLELDRGAATLSGGEARRVRIAAQLGSTLHGVTFAIDEPSAGLHARDHARLLDALLRLRDRGNTVLVVDHDPFTIAAADHVVDLGPGAGAEGGSVVVAGSPADVIACADSLTGAYLSGRRDLADAKRRAAPPGAWLEVVGAMCNNLADLDVRIPLECLVAVTGVSGSGKSSLLQGILVPELRRRVSGGRRRAESTGASASSSPGTCRALHGHEQVADIVELDRDVGRRDPRSTPATVTGVLRPIREVFAATTAARTLGYGPAHFSYNAAEGRCRECGGRGTQQLELGPLPAVEIPCEVCGGGRYRPEVLEVTHRGRTIADVLAMSASAAAELFPERPEVAGVLAALERLRVGHVILGQPLATLSSGETQRVRLARVLGAPSSPATLFVLDEPSSGLHLHDLESLLGALRDLVEIGHSVVLIEHNPAVIAACDHVIDLGPGAGRAGGRIVVEGAPDEVAARDDSHTGRAIRAFRDRTDVAGGARRSVPASGSEIDGDTGPAARWGRGELVVRGASRHTLRAVDVSIPHGAMTVITGVSGSGKSSLAVETIHAESRRLTLEALAPAAQRALARVPPAPVEEIRGLAPSIVVTQDPPGAGPRSTVGTTTDLDELLRVLWARAGRAHCPECSAELAWTTPARLTEELIREYATRRAYITAPVFPPPAVRSRGEPGEGASSVDGLVREATAAAREGFSRLLVGDRELRLDVSVGELITGLRESIAQHEAPAGAAFSGEEAASRSAALVVDRVVLGPEARSRVARSVELAFSRGSGWAGVRIVDGPSRTVSRHPGCPRGHFGLGSALRPAMFSRWSHAGACPGCGGGTLDRSCAECDGTGLRASSRGVTVGGLGITDIGAMTVDAALAFIGALDLPERERNVVAGVLDEVSRRLGALAELGLGYLTLDRRTASLAGGESRRVRLATQIGNRLSGVLYVLDEPTVGLHPRERERLHRQLDALRDMQNTLIIVEHDRETIRRADHVIELGPGAGPHGGEVIASGSPLEIERVPDSPTGRHLRGELPLASRRRSRRTRTGELVLRGVTANNLRGLDVRIPLGVLCGVCGPSGSGKSTLARDVLPRAIGSAPGESVGGANRIVRIDGTDAIDGFDGIAPIERVVEIDQSPPRRSRRATPATAVGAWDPIRRFFARLPASRVRGFDAGRFSFNTRPGRCATCDGDGEIAVGAAGLGDVTVPCEACGGDRFDRETLAVRYRGRHIGDVLRLDVESALELFGDHPRIRPPLGRLVSAGLGYLELGRPLTSLSGGELQRLKLAGELVPDRASGTLFILDEPTTGLHAAEVRRLLEVLDLLVDGGATVVVIEHDTDVLATCDWLVELGPGGGPDGGRIVAEGTPEEVARAPGSPTGEFLAVGE